MKKWWGGKLGERSSFQFGSRRMRISYEEADSLPVFWLRYGETAMHNFQNHSYLGSPPAVLCLSPSPNFERWLILSWSSQVPAAHTPNQKTSYMSLYHIPLPKDHQWETNSVVPAVTQHHRSSLPIGNGCRTTLTMSQASASIWSWTPTQEELVRPGLIRICELGLQRYIWTSNSLFIQYTTRKKGRKLKQRKFT